MKALPIGKQNFKEIIRWNYLYVDKTRQIYNLIQRPNLFFMSRPRRFGKSLLISILQHIFEGEKELFKGLYIYEKTNWDWKTYPVLYFNFAKFGYKIHNLEERLNKELFVYSQKYKVELSSVGLAERFEELVTKIIEQHEQIVLLIDEYDKPIVDFIDNTIEAKRNQQILKKFFTPLKEIERQGLFRLLFITGVSKFSQVSIFSDLNNLTDLTRDPLSNDLVGITITELVDYFGDYLEATAKKMKIAPPELVEKIKYWYDGYSWDGETFLFNPFSLLTFFHKKQFGNYWFATGTPTFLVKKLRQSRLPIQKLEERKVPEIFFDKFDLEQMDMYSLLFQTGYLTIKKVLPTSGDNVDYLLAYPNQEVRLSFIHNLLEAYTFKTVSIIGTALIHIKDALESNELDIFIEQLQIIFADITYYLFPKKPKNPTKQNTATYFKAWEGYFETIIFLTLSYVGMQVQCEVSKNKGRLDAKVETAHFLYIMEFKLNETATNALAQIKDRDYALAYKNSHKTIVLVGINFDSVERNVKDWEAEIWDRK